MRFILVLIITFLSLIVFSNENGIKSKMKQLMELKSKFKKKGKDNWVLLGENADDYPGSNEEKRQRQRALWEEHYDCLRKQAEKIARTGVPTPEALLALDGATINLPCVVCLPPDRQADRESVTWWRSPLSGGKASLIEEDERSTIGLTDKSLTLYNIQVEQSGRYQCKLGSTPTAPYFVSAVDEEDSLLQVSPFTAPKGPYEPGPIKLPVFGGSQLAVTTSWSDWEPCSRCGVAGKRRRIGSCLVTLEKYGIEKPTPELIFRRRWIRNIEHNESHTIRIKKKELWARSLQALALFPDGIPCHSKTLPKPLRDLEQLKNRKTLIMTGFCKVKCAGPVIFEVRDRKGNVIETANNSAGIYSTLQGVPDAQPSVVRVSVYEDVGMRLIIKCPGNLETDLPVRWKIGSKILNAKILKEQSSGRISINANDHIVIKGTRESDSHIYSCWQDNELAGTVRLFIKKKFRLSDKHIVLFGAAAILCTFLYVYYKAFRGRKRNYASM